MRCMICKKDKVSFWYWVLFLGHAICKVCDYKLTPGNHWSKEEENNDEKLLERI